MKVYIKGKDQTLVKNNPLRGAFGDVGVNEIPKK